MIFFNLKSQAIQGTHSQTKEEPYLSYKQWEWQLNRAKESKSQEALAKNKLNLVRASTSLNHKNHSGAHNALKSLENYNRSVVQFSSNQFVKLQGPKRGPSKPTSFGRNRMNLSRLKDSKLGSEKYIGSSSQTEHKSKLRSNPSMGSPPNMSKGKRKTEPTATNKDLRDFMLKSTSSREIQKLNQPRMKRSLRSPLKRSSTSAVHNNSDLGSLKPPKRNFERGNLHYSPSPALEKKRLSILHEESHRHEKTDASVSVLSKDMREQLKEFKASQKMNDVFQEIKQDFLIKGENHLTQFKMIRRKS